MTSMAIVSSDVMCCVSTGVPDDETGMVANQGFTDTRLLR